MLPGQEMGEALNHLRNRYRHKSTTNAHNRLKKNASCTAVYINLPIHVTPTPTRPTKNGRLHLKAVTLRRRKIGLICLSKME